MRFFILLLLCALSVSAQTNLGQIHLTWNYSSNTVCQDQTNGLMDWFKVRATNSIGQSASNWPVVYVQPWTNIVITNYDGTNYTFYIQFQVVPAGQMYFTSTFSNFWGESQFSNTSSTPALPSIVIQHIFPN
jgi:hypothetical protein